MEEEKWNQVDLHDVFHLMHASVYAGQLKPLSVQSRVLHGPLIYVDLAWFIQLKLDQNSTANFSALNRPKDNISMSKLSLRESSNYLIDQNRLERNTVTGSEFTNFPQI